MPPTLAWKHPGLPTEWAPVLERNREAMNPSRSRATSGWRRQARFSTLQSTSWSSRTIRAVTRITEPPKYHRLCSSMWFRAREAVLKPEYRDWYPGMIPGVGYRASWVAPIVQRQRCESEPSWQLEQRVPSDRHFFFRGGWRWPRQRQHARRIDHGLPPA